MNAAKKAAVKTGETQEDEQHNEMKTLMQQEMERRLEELPKLRDADQIDIDEKQL